MGGGCTECGGEWVAVGVLVCVLVYVGQGVSEARRSGIAGVLGTRLELSR